MNIIKEKRENKLGKKVADKRFFDQKKKEDLKEVR